jgi:uncharacterized protein YbaR (Trm112 family)
MHASTDSRRQCVDFNPRLLEQLACPACFGTLRLVSSIGRIVCAECRRAYPLIDGIPVLISERAMEQKAE